MKIFVGEMSKNEKNIKNLLGVFFTDMVGIKKILLRIEFFLVKSVFVKKTPKYQKKTGLNLKNMSLQIFSIKFSFTD